MILAFGGMEREDTKFFLETMNANLAREVQFLHEEVRFYRQQNELLLRRLGITEQIKRDINVEELSPIGGFKTRRQRIEEAEEASRKEFERVEENARKEQ